jgi:hypothetical protein
MNGYRWCTEQLDDDGDTHVYPLEDLHEHVLESLCPCHPELQIVNYQHLYVHNAIDFREVTETLNEEAEERKKGNKHEREDQ